MRDSMIVLRKPEQSRRKAALFDFDGTLSLIRRGWQQVMVDFMIEQLCTNGAAEPEAELRTYVTNYVSLLTGKQTIYQMIRLAEEIGKRGGDPLEPLEYKRIYHSRLWSIIRHRRESLSEGEARPDDWLLPGSRELLEKLSELDLDLYLASGTDLCYVEEEADLLRIGRFFQGRIYAALDDYRKFSKKMVIQRLIDEVGLSGPELISFGDGYVEIEETKRVGGVAIGVASNEYTGQGYDEFKRQRLTEAGADILIPNFLDPTRILGMLGLT